MEYYEAPLEFFNNRHPVTVMVIGAGGTGSLVMSRLARLHLVLVDMGYQGFDVKLVDPDVVEIQNRGRQLFTDQDVGGLKSEVIVSRINSSFGLYWKAYDYEFSMNERKKNPGISSNIVITCVDNIKCRKLVADVFYDENLGFHMDQRNKNFLWMDCGNGRDFGQVIISDIEHKLPNIFDLYPDLEKQSKNKKVQGAGCSIWETFEDQDLFINDFMALAAVQMLFELFKNKRLDHHASFVNINSMSGGKSLIKNIV